MLSASSANITYRALASLYGVCGAVVVFSPGKSSFPSNMSHAFWTCGRHSPELVQFEYILKVPQPVFFTAELRTPIPCKKNVSQAILEMSCCWMANESHFASCLAPTAHTCEHPQGPQAEWKTMDVLNNWELSYNASYINYLTIPLGLVHLN